MEQIFWQLIIKNIAFIWGLFFLFSKGQLLDFVFYKTKYLQREETKSYEPRFTFGFVKALYSCVVCMSSFWGVTFLVLNFGITKQLISVATLIYLIVLCGSMYLSLVIHDKLND